MKFSYLAISLVAGLVAGCSQPDSVNVPQLLAESLVKINYASGQSTHGSGFIIDSSLDGCVVLTAAHVVAEGQLFRISTHDTGYFESLSVRRSLENDDIAVLTFKVDGSKQCPYAALKLNDSSRVNIGDLIYLAGYPERSGNDDVFAQFPSGRVTRAETAIDRGYSLSYDVTAAGGMSGGPVVDTAGKVVGIHGVTDQELVALGRSEQSSAQSPAQEKLLTEAEERIESGVALHFKWGVPIRRFLEQKDQLLASNRKWNKLVKTSNAKGPLEAAREAKKAGRLQEAIALYKEAVQLDPDSTDARDGITTATSLLNQREKERTEERKLEVEKADDLFERGLYEEALSEYTLAQDIKNPVHWMKIGSTHYQLQQYKDAARAYKKATELEPESFDAWQGYAIALRGEGEATFPYAGSQGISVAIEAYSKSIEAFDKSLEIESNQVELLYGRASALEGLADVIVVKNGIYSDLRREVSIPSIIIESYENALAAYDQVLQVDSEYALAWNDQGHVLEKLNRMDDARKSYLTAWELEPENTDFKRDVGRARSPGVKGMPKVRER